MQKRKLFLSLLLVLIITVTASVLVACNDNNKPDNTPKEYTVTFNSAGGSSVDAQTVKSGDKAVKPSDPVKEDYDFKGWYIGETEYDFTAPVTDNITLTAKWEASVPKMCTLTFDSNGGSSVNPITVVSGEVVSQPQTNPTRAGYYFMGWFVGNAKYDFSAPLTDNVTVVAKWESEQKINDDFLAALQADYSNFTSASTVSDESGSYTDVFKQTADVAYWVPGTNLYEEHLIIFNEEGKLLAMYYLLDGEWKKSGLISFADFVVALYLDEIELDDVAYQGDGVYRVYDECVASVVYALFRSTDDYEDFYIQISDGRISKVWGNLAGEDNLKHTQTFYDFGNTEIEIPAELPAVTVSIETKTKETEVGTALDLDELISFLFVVKVEGKDYAITSDNVNFGDLDLDNPVEGEYTVTLSFETWDGATHTKTATVKVTEPLPDETFAEIFAKDYSNVTMSQGSTTYKYVDGVYTGPNAFYFVEEDGSLTKYHATSFAETKNTVYSAPRLDLLFALSSDIFEQIDENTYIAKNVEAIIPVLTNYLLMTSYKFNSLRDYSITLTINAGKVDSIAFSCYYVTGSTTPSATNGSVRAGSFTLSDYGTTEIEVPDGIKTKRGIDIEAASVAVYAEDKKYVA